MIIMIINLSMPHNMVNPLCSAKPVSLTTLISHRNRISHRYRRSCVAFSISKSVEPNEELKVGQNFSNFMQGDELKIVTAKNLSLRRNPNLASTFN